MGELTEAIVETRQELMVSPLAENPTLRIAHFLKPTSKPIKDSTFELLPSSLFPKTAENLSLEVAFNGWLAPHNDWMAWEEKLHLRYQNLWKKAGIFEAIKASKFRILKNQNLVLGLAQKWCLETNTFIFPWGEATITLEDMIVLGGYSVLGVPVFAPLWTKEQKEREEKLIEARRKLTRSKAKKASHNLWIRHFMENDGDLVHEAFLSLWLCRFVFPLNAFQTIQEHVFPIAIHLAEGTRVALAPAVLASIYKDLSLLKKYVSAATKWGFAMDGTVVTLRAPFQLVQVWALERFPSLQPTPNVIEPTQPMLAKWDKVKILSYDNVVLALDNAANCFLWRPYTGTQSLKFYSKDEKWVCLDPDSDDEIRSFAFCLRLSELVGIECLEQYLPHRVAMQFGLDQDIPATDARCKKTSLVAWSNYNKPMVGAKLYIASYTINPSVTSRYLNWWKQSILGIETAIKVPEHVNIHSVSRSEEVSQASSGSVGHKDSSVPPDFPPKFEGDEAWDSAQEDKLTTKEPLRSNESNRNSRSEFVGSGEILSSAQPGVLPSLITVEDFAESEELVGGSERGNEDVIETRKSSALFHANVVN